jgi:2',3'-cyclic-nucleotide 2'-phosphodiesterase (5'-nucleotidase family)
MQGGPKQVTLIHMGDVHGHLVPRPHLRSDGEGRMQGGLARMYTRIEEIRRAQPNHLLINTGDTIQGSAEALYTRGQALIDVLNQFRIDVFAPGNWEYVYGTERFIELFAGVSPKAPWNTIAANLYYDGEPFAAKTGQRVLPPYVVRNVGGVKIGILGLTTDRGPQVVGRAVTKGFRFLKNGTEVDAEVKAMVAELRSIHAVDLVVMASEMGMANNIRLAEAIPGIDVVLSSDMHEIARKPYLTEGGTLVVEEGQDGTVIGEITLTVDSGKVKSWQHRLHTIDTRIAEHPVIAAAVAEVRRTFVSGPAFTQHVNPFNGTRLPRPIDTVVGHTAIALHRSNFSHEQMPAVIEGSSHDFLADAFRVQTGADIGAIRGFRYGTHVAPGPIRMEDLYHFIPIGPMIAKGEIAGRQLKGQIENAADGSLSPQVQNWTGGWLFNFSGVRMLIDRYEASGKRASDIKVFSRASNTWENLNPERTYTYASYHYANDPDLINVVPVKNVQVLRDERGQVLDGVEVVVRYLNSLPNQTANPELDRIRLKRPLPKAISDSPEVQPWRGAK